MPKTPKPPILRHGPAVATAIRDRRPFTTSTGSLQGRVPETYAFSLGRMNDTERAMLERDGADVTYIVYSYSTPIAWYVGAEDRWHVVEQKFTRTTESRHKPLLYLVKPRKG